jgi:hypothetical protein
MRSEGAEQSSTYAGDPIETLQTTKDTARLPVRHDHLGQGNANARQPREFSRFSYVGIDQLPRLERASLVHAAVALRDGRSGRKRGEELNLTGRVTRPGGKVPDPLARHCQGKKEQQRSALLGLHAGTVRRNGGTAVGGFTRKGRE